ncbi:MAG: zinc-ribbon domain-containing protein [Pseudomonadota bacterium]
MLVFCEECGKRYSFPPEKVDPDSKKFRCRDCNFLMTVTPTDQEGGLEDVPSPPSPSAEDDRSGAG